jgi:HEPN/RES N-terminal domain 1
MDDPANVLPYETAEGGYQGDWFHTWDLTWTLGEDIGADDFVEDIVRAYGNTGWCDRDYFGGAHDEGSR